MESKVCRIGQMSMVLAMALKGGGIRFEIWKDLDVCIETRCAHWRDMGGQRKDENGNYGNIGRCGFVNGA